MTNAIILPASENVTRVGRFIDFKSYGTQRGINLADKATRKATMEVYNKEKMEFYKSAKAIASVLASSEDHLVEKVHKAKNGKITVVHAPKKVEAPKKDSSSLKAENEALRAQLAKMQAALEALKK